MRKKRTVYKCLCNTNGMLYSFSWIARSSPYGLTYKTTVINKPKIGKIFVFDSLENAILFIFDCTATRIVTNEIWECEASGVTPAVGAVYTNHFEDFWNKESNDYLNKSQKFSGLGLPEGSLYCSSLKLIKKVR
jgi:hypothetical protein